MSKSQNDNNEKKTKLCDCVSVYLFRNNFDFRKHRCCVAEEEASCQRSARLVSLQNKPVVCLFFGNSDTFIDVIFPVVSEQRGVFV